MAKDDKKEKKSDPPAPTAPPAPREAKAVAAEKIPDLVRAIGWIMICFAVIGLVKMVLVPFVNWINSPSSSSGKASATAWQAEQDKQLMKLSPDEAEEVKEMIMDRMLEAYQIPKEESVEVFSEVGDLPNSRFRAKLQKDYGITMPRTLEHFPTSVDKIPIWIVNDDERNVRNSYFFTIKVRKDKPTRPIDPYGWKDRIQPKDKTVSSNYDAVYNYGTGKDLRFEHRENILYKVKADGSREAIDDSLTKKDDFKRMHIRAGSYVLFLDPADTAEEREFIIHRQRE